MDKKEMVQKGSSFLRDCFHDAMEQYDKQEMALVVVVQLLRFWN